MHEYRHQEGHERREDIWASQFEGSTTDAFGDKTSRGKRFKNLQQEFSDRDLNHMLHENYAAARSKFNPEWGEQEEGTRERHLYDSQLRETRKKMHEVAEAYKDSETLSNSELANLAGLMAEEQYTFRDDPSQWRLTKTILSGETSPTGKFRPGMLQGTAQEAVMQDLLGVAKDMYDKHAPGGK